MAPLLQIGWLAVTASASPCGETTTTGDVSDALARAEAGYTALDLETFLQAVDAARAALSCVTDPVPRHLAASVHRFEGLRAFVDRDPARSMAAFAAARSIEPAWVFPEDLVPAGNPVLADYTALDPAAGDHIEVPPRAEGRLQFDASASQHRPSSVPTIVQLIASDGAVESTAYLWPDDPMPDYTVARESSPAPAPIPTAADRRRGPRTPLLVATGISGAAALSLWGASWLSHDAWDGTDDVARIDPLRRQTNGLVIGSEVAAGATVALALTTVVTARW